MRLLGQISQGVYLDEYDDAHAETQPNIQHEPVPVPSNNNPFTLAQFQHFNTAFH